jgi:hypothetical protein
MKSGIVWLASYPKSGNTWLRAFLANLISGGSGPVDINSLRLFGFSDTRADLYELASGKPFEALDLPHLHRLRPNVHRLITKTKAGTVYVKTHNAIAVRDGIPTITPEVTVGAIYILRNPLDVAVSYAHHFAMEIDHVIEAMASPDNYLDTVDRSTFSYLGSWSKHVEGWTTAPGLNAHVVRYEDMLKRPMPTFRGVASYLGLGATRDGVKRAIEFSSFDELKGQETKHGFRERGPSRETFFHQGRAEAWRNVLSAAQVDRVVQTQGEVMRRYEYLP